MTLWHNESETTESIKGAKAVCTHSIKETEANCTLAIKEAETHCSTAIREAESQGASQADSIQQSHAKDIQHLKEETIEEESKGQLNFLSTCQAALRAGPPESCGVMEASYHILLGHVPTSYLFNISQGASPCQQGSILGASSLSAPTAPGPSPRPKQWHHSPDPMSVSPLSKATSKATPKGPPSSKWWEVTPLYKVLMRSHQEAFSRDSHLVRKMREEYFRNHCPNFNNENSHDLTDIF